MREDTNDCREAHQARAVVTAFWFDLKVLCRACALGWLVLMSTSVTISANESEFFSGKQITLLCGAGVGGGYDALARVTARHLGRLIPGNPSVVVQNVPTAASIAAANRIYSTAPRDGTVLALVQRNLLTAKLFNPSAVRFDLAKFNWIGSLSSEVGVAFAWHTQPHRMAQDLFNTRVVDRRARRYRSGSHPAALQRGARHAVQDH